MLRTSRPVIVNPLIGTSFGSELFSEIFRYNGLKIVGPTPKCRVDFDKVGVLCKLEDAFMLLSGLYCETDLFLAFNNLLYSQELRLLEQSMHLCRRRHTMYVNRVHQT